MIGQGDQIVLALIPPCVGITGCLCCWAIWMKRAIGRAWSDALDGCANEMR